MAKRGRPDVFAANNMNDLKTMFQNMKPGLSKRAYENLFYMGQGMAVLKEAVDAKTGTDSNISMRELCTDKTFGKIANCEGIMEQLGRMSVQDHYNLESIFQVATIAAKKYDEGNSAHGVVQYMRTVRKTRVIYPKEAAEGKTVELTKEEQEITQIILFKAIHDLQNNSDSKLNMDPEISALQSVYKKIADPNRTGILQAMDWSDEQQT